MSLLNQVSYRPKYQVNETDDAYALTVYLPGVAKDGVEVTAEEGNVRVTGKRSWTQPEGWTAVYRESADAPYELLISHDNAIDGDRIAAEIRDGVLNLTLPKHEAARPRKIAVA